MCLAVPGRVIDIRCEAELRMGTIDFSGIRKNVCLEYLPNAQIGEYVLVHAGFAISMVDEDEVRTFYQLWREVSDAAHRDVDEKAPV